MGFCFVRAREMEQIKLKVMYRLIVWKAVWLVKSPEVSLIKHASETLPGLCSAMKVKRYVQLY
jgi:hypothetical protein